MSNENDDQLTGGKPARQYKQSRRELLRQSLTGAGSIIAGGLLGSGAYMGDQEIKRLRNAYANATNNLPPEQAPNDQSKEQAAPTKVNAVRPVFTSSPEADGAVVGAFVGAATAIGTKTVVDELLKPKEERGR